MSQSNTGHPQNADSSAQASSQALLDELRVAADRAREERLKLARLVKHSSDLPLSSGAIDATPAVQADRFGELNKQVQRLEQTVTEKLEALGEVQQDIDSRTQYLESLQHTIADTTRAFVNQVEQAQQFKAHVDAAKQHVRMSAGKVAEEVRQNLADCESPINDRLRQLAELDSQIDKRIARMQQMHKQANEAVDQHLLGALRSAKEQAADMAAPVKAELDKHLADQHAKIESAIQEKIAELDVDVEEALNPLTQRFNKIVSDAEAKAEQLAETLPVRLEAQAEEHVEALRKTLAEQAASLMAGMDEQMIGQAEHVIRERIATALDGYLAKAEEEAGGYVDGLIKKLDAARDEALIRFHDSAQAIEEDCALDREDVLAGLNHEIDRLKKIAEERAAHALGLVEQAADSIHSRASAAVDSALINADAKLDEYETAATEHLRVIDDGIEQSMEASRKRIVEHDKEIRKRGDELSGAAEASIAQAQQRLASFEAGIAQRIALATNSVGDAIGSVGERLTTVEQETASRIMQIVDLAESSGNAVADSIAALSASAEQTAAKAQQDLEGRLKAFEDISAQALHNAEKTMRANMSELRDASRAMLEVVTRQIKAQAGDIEPQTREVVNQAEEALRRRISELRDSAQGMVDLTISRLEDQLDEVKTRAQRAAFKGIQGNDAA